MNNSTRSITSQFTLRIVRALRNGALRFNMLERAAKAPNPMRLSRHVKKLIRDGLVERHVITLGPPAVTEYSLTPLGADLAKPAAELIGWVERNADQVATARKDHAAALAAQSA